MITTYLMTSRSVLVSTRLHVGPFAPTSIDVFVRHERLYNGTSSIPVITTGIAAYRLTWIRIKHILRSLSTCRLDSIAIALTLVNDVPECLREV